jgi:hypothetical protein
MLVSQHRAHPLIDWAFDPQPPRHTLTKTSLKGVVMPPRFIGRRSDLRRLKAQLGRGDSHRLLITGPGGQGKTALAGKLASDLGRNGYKIFAWSAKEGQPFSSFQLDLEMALSPDRIDKYDYIMRRTADETTHTSWLLRLLHEQYPRLVLFLDNLETVQSDQDQRLTDETVATWVNVASEQAGAGLILLLTSRWRLPGWAVAEHWALPHATYGDFLRMGREQTLPNTFWAWEKRDWRRKVYDVLHGNGRGLTFFAGAVADMDMAEEVAFLAKLAEATAETQTDMAIEATVAHLPPEAKALLLLLPVYTAPVPLVGIRRLVSRVGQTEVARRLDRLLAVSLVEQTYAPDLLTTTYQLSPVVGGWLEAVMPPPPLKHGT